MWVKKIILYLVLAGLGVACKEEKGSYKGLQIIKGFQDEALENGLNLEIASFEIVPLEMTPASILSRIERLEVVDSFLLIQDNEKVLCFNRSGEYQWYGTQGRGPGQYLRINTFFTDRNEKTVALVDKSLKKIMWFDLMGHFLSEKKYNPRSLYMVHSGVLLQKGRLLQENYIYNDYNTIYALMDLGTGERTPLYGMDVKTDNVAFPIGNHPVSVYQDTVKMVVPFDNKIYTLQDSTFIPVCLIETEKK